MFSQPYVYDGAQIVVKQGQRGRDHRAEVLKGKTVAVNLGSNFEQLLRELPYADEITIKTYESNIEQDTALGRVDAFVMDRVSSSQVIAKSPLPLELAGAPFSRIENALPFRNDAAGQALRDKVDAAITELKADGTLKAISQKWLGCRRDGPLLMQGLDLDYMLGLVPVILRYVPLTLGMALAAMAIALVLASVLAVIRVLRVPVVDRFVALFISFFRGTPLLVQLFLFYYGLPQVFSALTSIDGVTAAIMGLTLHFSAYMAESIRAAILGVDRSQWEASASVGMTRLQSMRRIILPQAARVAAPTLLNYFIDMIKSTSLAFTLGVTEMMGAAQKEAAGSFKYFEAFLVVAIFYWVIVEALSAVQRRMEVRLHRAFAR